MAENKVINTSTAKEKKSFAIGEMVEFASSRKNGHMRRSRFASGFTSILLAFPFIFV